jgi:hypothetical protein
MPTPTEMDTTGDTEAPPPGPPTPKRAKSTPETSEETILDRTTDGKEEHAQPPASRDKQDQVEEGAACEEGKGHDEIDPTDEGLSRPTHLLTPEDVTPPAPHAEGNGQTEPGQEMAGGVVRRKKQYRTAKQKAKKNVTNRHYTKEHRLQTRRYQRSNPKSTAQPDPAC